MTIWSNLQENIYEFVSHGTGNGVINAVAGSGKTTTIVEATKRAKGATLFLAFNKAIATELGERGVNARTFHSMCFSPVMRHRKQSGVEPNKLNKLSRELFRKDEEELYGEFVRKLISLGRQIGIGALVADTPEMWSTIIEHYDMELDSDLADIGRALELTTELMDLCYTSNLIDFDDLLYLTVRDNLILPKYDFIFVDEAQDTNAIQREILRKIMKPTSRLIAVGDPHQAIYGFRGADSTSLDKIVDEFNCWQFPLSVCYRCPEVVIQRAQKYVPHIEAAPNAKQGLFNDYGYQWDTGLLRAGDLVVCRTTKPLISLAYKMIKERRPVYVLGREIGQGLKKIVDKMNTNDMTQFLEKLEAYRVKEVDKATEKGQEGKAQSIQDKIEAIKCIADGMEDADTVKDLKRIIDEIFESKVDATILCTIHKSKGLEAHRVFWLNRAQCPPKWVKGEWQLQQEENLCYVAITRAKSELAYIEVANEQSN